MATDFQVTFDARDPALLAAFWAEAMGYVEEPPPPGYDTWEAFARKTGIPESDWDRYRAIIDPAGVGPRFFFQRVPEPKNAKNRMHLDLNVGGGREASEGERRDRVGGAAARLDGLGATVVRSVEEQGSFWIVMEDPEGNEFCLQ